MKHFYFVPLLATLFLVLQPATVVWCQQDYVIKGIVTAGHPLENVSIQLLPLDEYSVSAKGGSFSFQHLPAGAYQLKASLVGYVTSIVNVTVPVDKEIVVVLKERIVGLKEVSVVARAQRVGSSSVIDKSAIIHTQPVSLADVLQLIPGQLATNPSLGAAQQVNLRQIPSLTDAGRAGALGTQIIMDGVPVSNNANLQSDVTILNSAPYALPGFSSVAGRGNDLRQIPADNIENIEVIRGIPSVKYGDLTSGAIVVNSRIGAFRPEIRVRVNPNLMQAAVLTGLSNKKQNNVYNISGDLLRARDEIRDPLNQYTRLQGQFTWQHSWDVRKKFITTNIISAYTTLDNSKEDADASRYQSSNYSRDQNIKFSTNGKWQAGKKWLSSLQYTGAVTYSHQKSYYQSLITRDLFPIATAVTDTTLPGVYGKSEYLNKTTVDGKPINVYTKAEATLVKNIFATRHRFLAGTEWRMDVNKGKGRLFDPLTPPRQNYSMGDRPRSYSAVPALHQLSYYLEDQFSGAAAGHRFIVQAGVRWDNLSPQGAFKSKYKVVTSPRVNLSAAITKDLWLRGGYGIAAKMPALNYLYPGTRYFDLVNFNYFARDPAERLVVLTTRTIPLDDQYLLPYTSRKWEAGLDYEKKGFTASVSFFRETTNGAIGMNRELKPFTYARLQAESYPVGQPPVLSATPIAIDTFFAAYDVPVNNRKIYNKGGEFAFDLPEIKAIRTSLNITGAYIQTESFDDGHYIDVTNAYQNTNTPERIPIYQTADRIQARRMNTSIRFIHRIPALNIVFSALWQTVWISASKPGLLSPYPVAYMNRKGDIIPLQEKDAMQEAYEDLVRPVADRFTTSYPPLHLFNIRFTKEWKKGFGFSFYANNFLNSRPLHPDNNTGGLTRRNEPLFFGAEFNLSIQ